MEASATKLAKALLSRAWSGSSMQDAVANMLRPASEVKQELPDDCDQLATLIQDSPSSPILSYIYMLHCTPCRYMKFITGPILRSKPLKRHSPGNLA